MKTVLLSYRIFQPMYQYDVEMSRDKLMSDGNRCRLKNMMINVVVRKSPSFIN